MKVKIAGGWMVAMGLGVTAFARTYEQACKLERSAMKSMLWGIGIGCAIAIVVSIIVVVEHGSH